MTTGWILIGVVAYFVLVELIVMPIALVSAYQSWKRREGEGK